MTSLKKLAAKAALAVAALGGVFGVMAAPGDAQADPYVYRYYSPHVHVHRVYVRRVAVPYFAPPAIHVRTYIPEFDPWTPDEPVLIHGGFHFDAPYAPVLLNW